MISHSDYAQYRAAGYNRIPMVRTVLADFETPVSAYVKVAQGAYSYLLESVQGGEKWGRYSMIGLPCATVIKVDGDQVVIEEDGEVIHSQSTDDPLGAIQQIQRQFRVPQIDSMPRFTGGLVGYFGYEPINYEETPLGNSTKPDPVGAPDILLMVSDEVLVFDNLSGRLHVIVHTDPDTEDAFEVGNHRLEELASQIRQETVSGAVPTTTPIEEDDFVSSF